MADKPTVNAPAEWRERPAKKRSKMLSFRVTSEELRLLTLEAGRRRLTLSQLLRLAVGRLLGDD